MNKIDLGQLITAEGKAAAAKAKRREAARTECRRRIVAVADEAAQMNLANALLARVTLQLSGAGETEAAAASGLSEADVAQALDLRQWIEQMRKACATNAEMPDGDVSDDAYWPVPPAGARELAARF